ncbi:interleukin-10 receptor subunit alpha [Tachyglossus aculeatus]|uniref:interleukin-10 receptor subunit alpha n=1 Tax=Tachyglossus aculeatus TaxID=9261 RepID=UPI0018F316FB|nr:interleukin-10 receptor subunit alpha [Tachyglossus aculeatus]
MASCLLALAATLFLPVSPPAEGADLPEPQEVKFEAQLFHHILRWVPGPGQPANAVYEVQYLRYGESPWHPVPACTGTLALFCDLTLETLEPHLKDSGYFARVRAVAGNMTSKWNKTARLTLEEVILKIAGMKLKARGRMIHVELQLPRKKEGDLLVTYESIFEYFREYEVSIRRVSDNYTLIHKKKDLEEFNVKTPGGSGEFCVRVKPLIGSRPNHGLWSEESCVVLSEQYLTVTSLVTSCLGLILCVCLVLGFLAVHLYIKRPMKTPEVLKSLMKPSPSCIASDGAESVRKDAVHLLQGTVLPRGSQDLTHTILHGSTDSGFSSPQHSSPESSSCAVLPSEPTVAWGELRGSNGGGSSSSTDSGICLRSSCTGPRPEPVHSWMSPENCDEDSGISLAPASPGLLRSPRTAEYQLAKPEPSAALGHTEDPTAVLQFRGYLKQAKGLDVDLGMDGPLSQDHSGLAYRSCPDEGHASLAWSQPAPTQGYLKQSPPGREQEPLPAPWDPTGEDSAVSDSWGECKAANWQGSFRPLDPGLLELPLISSLLSPQDCWPPATITASGLWSPTAISPGPLPQNITTPVLGPGD